MRIRFAVAIVVAGTVLLSSSNAIAASQQSIHHRLPWPVYVGTSEGRFLIQRSGQVRQLSDRRWHVRASRVPRGWIQASHEVFAHVDHEHVVLTKGRETVWRSEHRVAMGESGRLWDVQVFAQGLVFQAHRHGPVYASMAGCPEQRVGRGLYAEGITRRGVLITLRPRTGTLASWTLARGPGRTLARGLSLRALDNSTFDRRTGTFLYWTRAGALVRTDGIHQRVLTDFHHLGFREQPEMYVLHAGLIELFSRTWRGIVLQPDGTVFAKASAPADGSVAGFGEQVARRDGLAVAYSLSPADGPRRSTVYLLRHGSTRGTPIYSGRGAEPCAVSVSWHARWLLFAPFDGHAVILDPAGRHDPIHLGAVIRVLPGSVSMIRWAFRPPGSAAVSS